MSYMNMNIYFMSGTGNSYRVSTWMGKIARGLGLNTQIHSIEENKRGKDIKKGNNNLIGIVFPTHGFTAPWHILKFAWNLPRGKSAHAFCAASRAGLKFGPVFIPGISGSAAFIVALILIIKGYKVRGLMSVDMPSNWFSLHPIQSKKNHQAIINRGENIVSDFIKRIISNGKVWFTLNNLYEIMFGIILFQVSIGYLLIGRFFLAKLFFANKNCNGCGLCADNCLTGAIKIRGRKNPRPYWKYNCESCMRCAAFCPKNVVEVGHSLGAILILLATIPASTFFLSFLESYVPGIVFLKNHWAASILYFIYLYIALFTSYYIFYGLARVPVFNWLFTHTTMTHFSFWGRYHEPDTRIHHITGKKNKDHGDNRVKL